MEGSTSQLSTAIQHALAALEFDRIQQRYWAQNECVVLEHFLPDEVVGQYLLPEAEKLRADVHRNYIPRHKKGGSVSYYTLVEKAPAVLTLYRHPAFIDFLSRLVGAPVMPCPETDPHACALYFYTEPDDHIGFHYDTSYYQGARYTVLVGLVQRSQHCQLVCQLYKGDPTRERQDLQLTTHPGTMVIFNGDKLWHAVTPPGTGSRAHHAHHGVRDQSQDGHVQALYLEHERRHRLLRRLHPLARSSKRSPSSGDGKRSAVFSMDVCSSNTFACWRRATGDLVLFLVRFMGII